MLLFPRYIAWKGVLSSTNVCSVWSCYSEWAKSGQCYLRPSHSSLSATVATVAVVGEKAGLILNQTGEKHGKEKAGISEMVQRREEETYRKGTLRSPGKV